MVNKMTMLKQQQKTTARFNLSPLSAGVRLALTGMLAGTLSQPVLAELPVVTPKLPVAAPNWVGSGAATKSVIGNKLQINQTTNKAILNWQSFNIGADKHVNFTQPGASSIALNRIGGVDPSRIRGALTANGQIYLINKNGFIFGKNSIINVASLIASTHDISDDVFDIGITEMFGQTSEASFKLDEAFKLDAENNKILKQILIEQGAKITASDNGNIIIVAPEIENNGELKAGNFGQIILVASQDKVYLQQADSEQFKRLLVEVDTGGKVSNFGDLLVKQGDITMVGFMVNQSGRVNATTSATINGTVRLLAREKHQKIGQDLVATSTTRSSAQEDGLGTEATVKLAGTTVISVDENAGVEVDGQIQPNSWLEISAHTVEFKGSSRVEAANARVEITASDNIRSPLSVTSGRIVMEQGSVLDVSGVKGVDVAIARNIGEVDAISSKVVRDSPNQRGGILTGKKLLIDLRKDTKIVDVEGAKKVVQRSVSERLSEGGNITMTASGDIEIQKGAKIDISGGSVDYQDGYITTTQLINEAGQQFDISDANPDDKYVGISRLKRFEAGYTEGRDAGSLKLKTKNIDWKGQLVAGTVNGRFQRTQETMAKGGEFSIDLAVFNSIQNIAFKKGNAMTNLALSGLQSFGLKTLGEVSIDKNVSLAFSPFSQITLEADAGIQHQGHIYTAGGEIKLDGLNNGSVFMASGSTLDVSGRRVNDFATLNNGINPVEAIVIKGGKVSITSQNELILDQGSKIYAEGGAHYSTSRKVTAGEGGSINLTSFSTQNETILSFAGADLSAKSLTKNGRLSLTGNQFEIGDNSGFDEISATNLISADDALFSNFSAVSLRAKQDITLTALANIDLRQQNFQLTSGFYYQQSGQSIRGVSQLKTLPQYLRSSSDFTLFAGNNISMLQGSSIVSEIGSTVSMTANKNVFVDGRISTPAGKIALKIDALISGRFENNQAVWLGEHAELLAQGAVNLNYDPYFRTGSVEAGGEISLEAERGYVVIEEGAKLDVSGTATTLDIAINNLPSNGYQRRVIGSDAGSISLIAAEGMALEGEIKGSGGTAANFSASLSIELDNGKRNLPEKDADRITFPTNPLVISLSQKAGETLSSQIAFGDALDTVLPGRVDLYADALTQAGLGNISLKTFDTIQFQGHVDLTAKNTLAMDASLFEWVAKEGQVDNIVNLNATHIVMGSSKIQQVNGLPVAGDGILNVNADWMRLFGGIKVDGAKQVNLTSFNDIQVLGNHLSNVNDFSGEFVTAANLNLTASKIYPSSVSRYRFAVENNTEGTINVFSTTGNKTAPLSAAGELTLQATNINQAGTLLAPLGKINLQAEKNLKLANGSITSVSAEGLLIPFGNVVDGLDWVYPLALNVSPELSSGNLLIGENTKLEKKVLLQAADVVKEENAVVNLAGGGDIYSYEFIPGLGGSFDYLQPGSGSFKNSFAILPSLGTSFAPYDHFQSNDFNFAAGETVVLNGGNGLPSGEFAKLPAHYALLPGAFLVTAVEGTLDHGQTTRTIDGRPIISGYSSIAGLNKGGARTSGFMIENGAQVRKQSQYVSYTGDEFFINKANKNETRIPILARDGGLVSIQAQTRLIMEGLFNVAAPDGIGARMDIAANNIRITDELSATTEAGVLEILASNLNGLNVASLLLGGSRSIGTAEGETIISVGSENITIEDGSVLDVADLMIAAKNTVTVKQGATVTASAAAESGDKLLTLNGDGALLRVSGSEQVDVSRVGSTGNKGRLVIEEGAIISAKRSMLLDSSLSTDVSGQIIMEGGSLNLAANSINIGEVAGESSSNALNLSNAALDKMSIDELVLTSRDAINFYGTTGQLDANGIFKELTGGEVSPLQISTLSINAAGFSGHSIDADSASDSVNIKVDTLELKNTLGAIASLPATGSGTMNIEANKMLTGDGSFVIDGFNQVNLRVNEQFKAEGVGGLKVDADLNLKTPVMTAASRGDYEFDVTGYQAIFDGTGVESTLVNKDLTGRLGVTADQVTINTRIDLASGTFDVDALTADVVLGEQAVVDLSGREFVFADVIKSTKGGKFNVNANKGSIRFNAGSLVNLNGGGNSQQAGNLKLDTLEGNAHLEGELMAQGGSVEIDVSGFEQQSDFDLLFSKLADAGITKKIDYRSANEDITVSTGTSVVAENVKLSADKGAITVAGTINADATENSQIELIAGGGIIIAENAILTAKTESDNKGGRILLSTTDKVKGGIDIKAGSVIEVGNNKGTNGKVVLTAPRLDRNADGVDEGINITQVAGEVKGIVGGGFYAEGSKVYKDEDGNITSVEINKYKDDAASYMSLANRQAVKDTLHPQLQLRPGIEIQSEGDLNLTAGLDTADWRYSTLDNDDSVGRLALRAAGNLNISKTISDGFISELLAGNSWSFVLASGADLKSGDYSAVTGGADITLARNTIVRTGNGDISLYAAGDINFTDQSSVIYNMGRQDVDNAYGKKKVLERVGRDRLVYEYPVEGGNIEVTAGGNINGATSDQFMNEWLRRTTKLDRRNSGVTAFGVVLNKPVFEQGIGSFGGGNVAITAAGDINNISVMMPTTGKPTEKGVAPIISGGGNMTVIAEGNIAGGAYYTGKGRATLSAGKSIKGGDRFSEGPVIAIGDSQFSLTAGDDIRISSVIDPMLLHDKGVNFFSYTDKSEISIDSLSGDIYLSANSGGGQLQQDMGNKVFSGNVAGIYPGKLNATATDGSILFKNNISLFPSTEGQLNLLAENDIRPLSNASRINIALSDADVSSLPRTATPVSLTDLNDSDIRLNPFNFASPLLIHAANSPHANSSDPVRLVAKQGSIESLQMNFPKRSIIQAGKDLAKNKLYIQHLNENDYSTISAGRDITSASSRNIISGAKDSNSDLISISGPGDVIFKTGRDLDLGRSDGILSVGNQLNSQLAEAGANLTFLVGVTDQPDYIRFIKQMSDFKQQNAGNEITHSRLFEVIDILASIDDLDTLKSTELNKVVMPLFFKALKEGGKAESLGNVLGNKMGFHAIENLFPEHTAQGDLKMFFSTIQTQNGGSINMAVPGGGINVGLASSSDKNSTEEKVLGILALGEGEVNAFLNNNLDVNQARMFTLGGEDILVWSSNGDIDAGKGAKAAFSSLPPLFSYVDDKVVVKNQPNVAGSGINADFKGLSDVEIAEINKVSEDDRKQAVLDLPEAIDNLLKGKQSISEISQRINLAVAPLKEITVRNGLKGLQGSGFLFAPKGIINASEAGISANNLFIVAKAVLGANNISVSGSSVGVGSDTSAAPPVSGLSNNSSANVSKNAENSVQGNSTESDEKQLALGLLSVDVVGFGSGSDNDDRKKKKL